MKNCKVKSVFVTTFQISMYQVLRFPKTFQKSVSMLPENLVKMGLHIIMAVIPVNYEQHPGT